MNPTRQALIDYSAPLTIAEYTEIWQRAYSGPVTKRNDNIRRGYLYKRLVRETIEKKRKER